MCECWALRSALKLNSQLRSQRQTILADERLGGRKQMLTFAREHNELDVKGIAALEAHDLVAGDWKLAISMLTELVEASGEQPEDRRRMRELRRALERCEGETD